MKVHSTNYFNTLITVAEDCKVSHGTIPSEKENKKTIANYQFELLSKSPFKYTSDEALFTIHSKRNDLTLSQIGTEKIAFFSKRQPCFRTSPLPKTYGWGIYFNEEGKIKLIDSSSQEYISLINNTEVQKVAAMKSKR